MDKKYLQKQVKRATQRAKLLIARPDFQEEVAALRRKYAIPQEGLRSQSATEDWHRNFSQSHHDHIEKIWPKKRREMRRLEKEHKFLEAELLRQETVNAFPLNAFDLAIKRILKTYKLSLLWKEFIRRYILFNDIKYASPPLSLSIRGEFDPLDKNTGIKRLYIEIDDRTTLEDVKQWWKDVKFFQEKLHSRVRVKFQPIKMLERDQRAFELRRSGKKLGEISAILDEEFGRSYETYEISKLIDRHRKKIGIN